MNLSPSLSGLGVVNREVRGEGHIQFPWKLIDRSLGIDFLNPALLDHQLDVLVVQDADEVALGVAVVHGDVVLLEDVSETRRRKFRKFKPRFERITSKPDVSP